MKGIFGFLYGLHDALWELLFNGRRPDVKTYQFILVPGSEIPGKSLAPGERIFRDGHMVLRKMMPG